MIDSIFMSNYYNFLNNNLPLDSVTNKCKELSFRIASYLTDPACKSRECYYMAQIVDELYPIEPANTIQKTINVFRKYAFLAGYGLYTALAAVTTVPGIALRSLAANISSEPFLYKKGKGSEKTLSSGDSFSLLSWNICFVPGGYSITDGGVVSYFYRAKQIATEIVKQDADVVCLYETFDTGSAMDLAESLKENYAHIYYNICPQTIGTSSGIFIASKFPISDLEIKPFPEDTLVGTTKYSAKSVVGFTVGKARIFTTHAQHGEEPEFATEEELVANRRQMEIIIDKVKQVADKNLAVIVCGDLNVTRENLEAIPSLALTADPLETGDSSRVTFFDGNKAKKIPTWDGDASCAPRFYGKKISRELELDYILALSGSVKTMITKIGETFYNPETVTWKALSDHRPLLAEITLN